jgi:hypothetical protein
MTIFDAVQDIDGQGKVIRSGFAFRTKKTITFAGATADAWGNDGGALDGGAIFTVTGLVKVQIIAECTTSLTGATATIELGITGDEAIYLPTETATQIDAGQIWINSASTDTYQEGGSDQEAVTNNLPVYLLNGLDIILTVKTADVETGVIDFFALWTPVSDDGAVEDSGN